MVYGGINMMKKLLFILCAVLMFSASACKSQPTWQEQYDLGIRYLSDGNYEEAIIAFTAAIEIDDRQVLAYIGRGDAYVSMAATSSADVEELVQDAIDYYENALDDYITAISIMPEEAETYRKAAEIYVILDDIPLAIEILERGVEATGNEELQAFLEQLKEEGVIDVVAYQEAYRPNGTIARRFDYYYDEQGYLIRRENTRFDENGVVEDTDVDTWEYTEEEGMLLFVPDRSRYRTDEKWEAAKTEDYQNPKDQTYSNIISVNSTEWSICTIPFPQNENTYENGILRSYGVDSGGWDHAIYTFDEKGRAVEIMSYYSDGSQSGRAVIGWTELELY